MVIEPIPEPDRTVERALRLLGHPRDVRGRRGRRRPPRRGAGRRPTDGDDVVWAEGRPAEGGRTQLVRRRADGGTRRPAARGRERAHRRPRVRRRRLVGARRRRLVRRLGRPAPVPARARRRARRRSPPSPPARAATATPTATLDPDGTRIVCVRERHHGERGHGRRQRGRHPRRRGRCGEPEVLVTGPDFVAAPRLSPGRRHAGLAAVEPPGDAVGRRRAASSATSPPARRRVVAGGPGESVTEPRWRPTARCGSSPTAPTGGTSTAGSPATTSRPWCRIDADIGVPAWAFGASPLRGARRRTRWSSRAGATGSTAWPSARPDGGGRPTSTCPSPPSARCVAAGPDAVVVVAGSPTAEPGVHRVELSGAAPRVETLRAPRDLGLDPGDDLGARSRSRSRRRRRGRVATGTRCSTRRPTPALRGPAGERPPLLVVIHGGPTSAALAGARLGVQYWTSRGFAVVDVDYGGSTGYGRAYRELLPARGASSTSPTASPRPARSPTRGRVDPARLCIRGGSAGGFTTLAALARDDTPFAAGADHFGVADLEALARDTHKFESRYLDGLVGPYPEAREVYVERSPIHHVDGFAGPLIVLQGVEDAIVPPAQSEMIVDALRAQGRPGRLPALRGRAARLPPGREHPPGAGRRAVVLRAGARVPRSTRTSSPLRWRTSRPRWHSRRA